MEIVAKFWTKYTLIAVGSSLKLGILKMKGRWTLETAPEKLESLHNPVVFLSISCQMLGDYGCSSGQLVAEAGRELWRNCEELGVQLSWWSDCWACVESWVRSPVWCKHGMTAHFHPEEENHKFKIILSYTVNLRLAGIHETLSQKNYNKSIK